MKHIQGKIIIGSAIGLTTLALAIDHTRQILPNPEPQQYTSPDSDKAQKNPCSLDEDNPCSLDEDNPCSLDDDNPCNLDYSA